MLPKVHIKTQIKLPISPKNISPFPPASGDIRLASDKNRGKSQRIHLDHNKQVTKSQRIHTKTQRTGDKKSYFLMILIEMDRQRFWITLEIRSNYLFVKVKTRGDITEMDREIVELYMHLVWSLSVLFRGKSKLAADNE
jgi:hypothetical protein